MRSLQWSINAPTILLFIQQLALDLAGAVAMEDAAGTKQKKHIFKKPDHCKVFGLFYLSRVDEPDPRHCIHS